MTEPPSMPRRRRLNAFQWLVAGLVCMFLLVVGFGAISVINDVSDLRTSAQATRVALSELKQELARHVATVDKEVGKVAAMPLPGQPASASKAP